MNALKPAYFLALVLALFVAGMAAPPTREAPKPAYFSIATGPAAGAYFPVGSTIATILSHPSGSVRCEIESACGPDGLIAVAVVSAGSLANVRDVEEGRANSGLAQANVVARAFTGAEGFKGQAPYANLRAIARLYPAYIQLVVARGAGIRTIADLKHKRVAIDVEGSGTHVEALRIMAAENLDKYSVKFLEAGADRAADLLAAKKIDAFFFIGGPQAETITNLARMGVADLVPITGAAANALTAGALYFMPAAIPAGAYPGIGRTETVSVGVLWIVNANADGDLIYRLTSALWNASNQALLMRGQVQNMSLKHALDGIAIPLHPGAERFYIEKGLVAPRKSASKDAVPETVAAKTR